MNEQIIRFKEDNERALEIKIRCIQNIDSRYYFVELKDKIGVIHAFNMESKGEGGLKIINAPKVEDWILTFEDKLSDFIDGKGSPAFGYKVP